MKNISPVSPLNEIVPENTAPEAADQDASLVEQPDPGLSSAPVPAPYESQPTAATAEPASPIPAPAAERPFYQETTSLYPTPLSSGERQTLRDSVHDVRGADKGMTISQFGIMLVSGIYALAVLLQLFRALTAATYFSTAAGGYGLLGSYVWAALIVGVLQCLALLFAAYKVSQGSLAGLAFVTGISIMILPQFILLYLIRPGLLQGTFQSLQSGAQFIGLMGLAIMLVLAWTKERRHYG